MSLIKCSECGKEMSSRAEKCPNCGCPIIFARNGESASENLTTFDEAFIGLKAEKIANIESYSSIKKMIGENENVRLVFCSNISINPRGKNPTVSIKGKKPSVIAITGERIIAGRQTLGIRSVKEMYLSQIQSIDAANKVFSSQIRIVGMTEMFIIDCNKKTQNKIMAALKS